MPLLPSATVSIDDESGSPGAGSDLLHIMSPCSSNADMTPRLFSSIAALLDFHGYCQGADLAAIHMDETGLPVMFSGLPVSTAGAVSQQDDSGVTGSCNITVSGTPLDESDIVLVVTAGGTVATSQIKFDLSLDGGYSFRPVKLGTATTYAVPRLGITLNFGAGTLAFDDDS